MQELVVYGLCGWTAINLGWMAVLYHETEQQKKHLQLQKKYQVSALLRAMRGVIWTPGEERDLDHKLNKLEAAKERWGALDKDVQEAERILKQLDLHRLRFGVVDPDGQTEQWFKTNARLIEHIVAESEHIDALVEVMPELLGET